MGGGQAIVADIHRQVVDVHHRWQLALESGLRPVAAGTILAAVWVLMQALEGGWLARAIALLATSALLVTRLNPILLPSCWAGLFVALHGLAPA